MNTRDPDHFDAALRRTWHDAARHLPGPLQLQLSPALAAQRRRAPAARRWWLPAAGAFASLALAAGLWWSPAFGPADPAAGASIAQVAADAASVAVNDDDAATELLTRNPDFYAWLGTEEARSLAME